MSSKNTSYNKLKKILLVGAVWLYIFFIVGLIFHTSLNKEQIFGKYGISYFLFIIFVLILFIPYLWLIKYLIITSTYKFGRRKINLTPSRKFFIILLLIIVVIFITEVSMRVSNTYKRKTVYDMDFHPFLQDKLGKNLGYDYHTNSYGFRAEEINKEKNKEIYRVVILGGSTAYGVSVPYEKNSAKLLEEMLNKRFNRKIEVINAGVSGYNSEHSIIDYMFRISDFKPDLVIMWHGVNDMYASCANTFSISGPYQSDYSHLLGPLTNMVTSYFYPPVFDVHLFTFDYISDLIHKYLYSDFSNIYENLINKMDKYKKSKIPSGDMDFPSIVSYQRNLNYFISLVRINNSKLILGNQPNMFNSILKYDGDKDGIFCYNGKIKANLKSQTKGMERFNKVTKDMASKNNVPFIDLDSIIPRTPEYFLDQIHWTQKGHLLAAKKLYDFILTNNFIIDH